MKKYRMKVRKRKRRNEQAQRLFFVEKKARYKVKITKGTIIRAACLLLALINMILTSAGHSPLPIDEAWLEAVVSDSAVFITAIIAAWKNNSFTAAALKADTVMRSIKILSKHGAEIAEELSNGKGDKEAENE